MRKTVIATSIRHKNDDAKFSFFDKCHKFSRTIERIKSYFFNNICVQAFIQFYLLLNVSSIHRYDSVLIKQREQIFHQTILL